MGSDKSPSASNLTRRSFLSTTAKVAGAMSLPVENHVARAAGTDEDSDSLVRIDPTPLHDLSPHLYMQFMEPLGTTDSSVEASWDHLKDEWRPGLIEATKSLGPSMVRWGGLFCSYYRWREGVGPRSKRIPMHNIVWGGVESNQVGTAEFVIFCQQVNADALMCVNFESDGRPNFREAKGSHRVGDAREAAEWVAYCNQWGHPLRKEHGFHDPLSIKYWQLGNETSYARNGFDLDTSARKTVEFAKAMRQSDPNIKIIGWGDSGWAPRMAEVAGEHLQYLAFHHMFDPDDKAHPVLKGEHYRRDPAATWDILMKAWELNDQKIRGVRDSVKGLDIPLAMTECHFAIQGNNRNDVLRSWAAGVSYARILNNHQRHGDVLKIATAADFCGTRWTVNAIMLGTHPWKTFLMPVALIMRQFRQYKGHHAVRISNAPEHVDVVASRSWNQIFLNLVNTSRTRSRKVDVRVEGMRFLGGSGAQIAENPATEISSVNCDEVMQTKNILLTESPVIKLPPASVTSLALTMA